MGFTSRTVTYWDEERLMFVKHERPSGRGPWPRIRREVREDLVAIIDGVAGSIKIEEGINATPDRVADSVLLHYGVSPDKIDTSIWREIPESLIETIRLSFAQASGGVAEQWYQFSNEEAVTGYLFGSAAGEKREGGWTARLKFIEFSKQRKEGETGADIAIVIDALTRDGRRAVKTIWFQAKQSAMPPSDWRTLPRLEEQMKQMRTHTRSSYGVVYTRHGSLVFSSEMSGSRGRYLEDVIADAMRCKLGDERPIIVAQSLDRLTTYGIFLSQEPV